MQKYVFRNDIFSNHTDVSKRVWGDRQVARLHWGALKRLLLERGGFPGLQHNPPMHTKIVW